MKKIIKTAIGTMALTLAMGTTVLADSYTVQKGDSFWKISNQYGISVNNILVANNANENTIIYPGQVITIPTNNLGNVENINNTIETQINNNYGEYLNWFGTVDNLIPRGTSFKVIDFYTGKSYMVKRTGGSNHADSETLTTTDTEIMKSIWRGYSWTRRPAIVEYNGRRIAASITFMPHAGLDSVSGGVTTNNRSGAYGRGINYDFVKGNGIDGHFDIHFLGSKRHKDNQQDSQHQQMIKIAAGIK